MITVKMNFQAKTLAQLEMANWIAQDVENHYFHFSYETTVITINEIYYNRFTQAWHFEGRILVRHNMSLPIEQDDVYDSAWSTSTTRKRIAQSSGK